MRERFLAGRFGSCPRVLCEKQNTLPIGISQDLKIARVKTYCPRCKDVFSPKKKSADADGAFFGTSFPYLLLMVRLFSRQTYSDLKPYFKKEEFVPKVFGFKLESHDEVIFRPAKEQENTQVLSNNVINVESEIKPSQLKKKNKKKKNKQQEMEVE